MTDNEVIETSDSDIPSSEEDADALIAQAESEAAGSNQDVKDGQPTQAQVDAWNAQDWAFKTAGREVIPQSKDQVRKWAEMGYSAPQKIGELQKQINEWKQKESFINENHKKYGEIDDYVKQNPQFWQHVMQAWQNRSQALSDPNNPMAQTVNTLQQQVQELVQYKTQIEQQQQQIRMQQEDQAYLGQLDEMKKSYPKVDFDTPDESGKSLEFKVLEYAQQAGIKNFKTAFRDFYHDELVKLAAEDAKERVVKDRQKNTKLGIIGKTPTPTKGMTAVDPKGRSWSDPEYSADKILAELGMGS